MIQIDEKNKKIIAPKNFKKSIQQNPKIILDTIYLASISNVRIDFKDIEMMNSLSTYLEEISNEDLRIELLKILSVTNIMYAIELLRKVNFFRQIIPEVQDLVECQQDILHHPEGTVYTHTLLLLYHLKPDPLLRLAGLFHDIGKPLDYKEIDGRITTHGHDKTGVKVAKVILEELNFERKDIEYVLWLIENHMQIKKIKEMRASKVRKLMQHKYFDDLVILAKADCNATSGYPFRNEWLNIIEDYKKKFEEEDMKPIPILNGRDLLEIGITPSKNFGKILSEVYNKQLEGSFISKSEARKYVVQKFIK